jgi:predicted RNase H-like HicB family nuclease
VTRLRYLVRINKDPDSDWGASVPDLPGCVVTGKPIDSTLRRSAMESEAEADHEQSRYR